MHVCPQCNVASIPAWRAFAVISFLEKPISCRHCGARLKLRRGSQDVLPMLPVVATSTLAHYLRAGPSEFVIWAIFVAAVGGLAIYASLVRYKVVEEPIKFTPHPSSPPRA
jgi:nucleoside permease NupC